MQNLVFGPKRCIPERKCKPINTGILVQSAIFAININAKGDGDTISHLINANVRILTFYNELDGGRQMNDFFCDTITNTSFKLRNDFTNDKFTGILIVVKTGNSWFTYPSVIHNIGAEIPTYANNSEAILGGLNDGDFYRTSTGVLMVVYNP